MVLFSATINPEVQNLIDKLFAGAEVIRTQGSHQLVSTLTTQNLKVENGKRFPLLEDLLTQNVTGGTLIFTNTRQQCDTLAQQLVQSGRNCVIYRGEMDKVERRRNLKAFRDGKVGILIATDLASRGLDIEHAGRIINYHVPQQLENYIHRVGRTARAGRKGLVINLVTERDQPFISQLPKIQKNI
jgi:superfamily II DNA/RNA helicase